MEQHESDVVAPDTKTLQISDGHWLRVKQRLNAGENRRMAKRGTTDGGVGVDLFEAGVAKILAFLLDWSLKDATGATIPIARQAPDVVEAAIDAISPERYTEILRAIEAHELAMKAERDAKKKTPTGEPTSSVTSPSVAPVEAPSATEMLPR